MKPTRLDNELFARLAGETGERLISIAVPTHVRGRETSQDRIRLKNQLAEVDSELEAAGVKPRDRRSQLDTATGLLDDVEFWEHQSEQLAMYIDDTGEVLPMAVSRQSQQSPHVVSTVYHLRYVLPDLNPLRLPVLVLTEKAVKLYYVTPYDLDEAEADLPASFEDVNWFVDRETQRQQHPDRVGSSRNRHGHAASNRADEDSARFLRAVRDALLSEIGEGPLVVLGDDKLVNRFEKVSPNAILSPGNSGIDDLSAPAIHNMALPELEKHRKRMAADLKSEAMDSLGVGNATVSLTEALQDAVAGRISRVLLHADAEPVWGRFDKESLEIETHESQQFGDADLIDRIVAEGFETGAEIAIADSPLGDHEWVAIRRF